MNETPDDRSTRFVRWWVRRYTAGLAPLDAESRRSEIDSDLAEHRRCRDLDGWTTRQIARERVVRVVRGMVADVGWRHDLVTARSHLPSAVRMSLLSVTSLAGVLLAVFHAAFAAYMLGQTSLADQRFLGGLTSYADEVGRPVASPVAAIAIAVLGAVLIVAAVTRPVSPIMSNAATIGVAVWAVLWFWLGMWPIGLVAVIGSAADLAIRNPASSSR